MAIMYKVIVLKERFGGIDKGKLYVNGFFLLKLYNLKLFEICLLVWTRKRRALSKPYET